MALKQEKFRDPNLCLDSKPERYKAPGCIGGYCPWSDIVYWRYVKSNGKVVHPKRLQQYAREERFPITDSEAFFPHDYTPCLPHCKKCGEKIKIIKSRMVDAATAITTCFTNMRPWSKNDRN